MDQCPTHGVAHRRRWSHQKDGAIRRCMGLEPLYKCRFANLHLLPAVANLFIIEGKEAISVAVKMVFLTLIQVVSYLYYLA